MPRSVGNAGRNGDDAKMTLINSSQDSLFDRLGGREGIGEIVAGLYVRLHADPRINGFWKGHSDDSNARELQSVIDFVCQEAGGPALYSGRDMQTSHDGLVITRRDWAVFAEHALAVLIALEIPEREKQEVLAFLESFKEVLRINEHPGPGTAGGPLSQREEEVLRLIAAGNSNPEIARTLSISLNTVTRHVTNIFDKTGTTNRVEAALYADRSGLS